MLSQRVGSMPPRYVPGFVRKKEGRQWVVSVGAVVGAESRGVVPTFEQRDMAAQCTGT